MLKTNAAETGYLDIERRIEACPHSPAGHWSRRNESITLTFRLNSGTDTQLENILSDLLVGGSERGQFISFSDRLESLKQNSCLHINGSLPADHVILDINFYPVSGFTRRDAIAWINQCIVHNQGVVRIIATPAKDGLSKDLRQYLNSRFAKGSLDHELQNTIRDNLYLRTVPVTTRPRRNGENEGIDYTFLTVEQFRLLEKNGTLLESGIYDGNFYGTPKPPLDSPLVLPSTPLAQSSSQGLHIHSGSASVLLPGAHPSSEGKRRRNRSNVEAMAAKSDDPDDPTQSAMDESSHLNTTNGNSIRSPTMSIPSYREDGGGAMGGLSEAELGSLPPNWEKAYTERGEVYFIDHNTGTSQWLDPRLSKIQKKSLEECGEDELPYGWEKIDDPHYGTYYIDHVNRKTQYENPVTQAKKNTSSTTTGNASSTDSGNSTYPRLKKQQNEANSTNTNGNSNNSGTNVPKRSNSYSRPFFTRNPAELQGERICTTLVKSNRGLGFTIVGGDDSEEEFLQIKSVVPHGPAWVDGRLRTGDVLVYVNDQCVLGYTHHDMVNMFQAISPGQAVALEVCRGYPLPFDPNDPNTEIVTTVAVATQDKPVRPGSADLLQGNPDVNDNDGDEYGDGNLNGHVPGISSGKIEFITVQITKGATGFGFTIADSAYGQKVKTILDRPRCKNLQEGDILVEINGINMRTMPHSDVVQVLKDCPWGRDATVTVQRGGIATPTKNKWKKGVGKEEPSSPRKPPLGSGLFRSKTPTADLYSVQTKEVVPNRPKTPLVDTRNRPKTPSMGVTVQPLADNGNRDIARTPVNTLIEQFQNGINFQDSQVTTNYRNMNRSRSPGRELDSRMHYENGGLPDSVFHPQNGYPPGFESDYGRMPPRNRPEPYTQNLYSGSYPVTDPHRQVDYGYGYSGLNGPNMTEYTDDNLGQFHRQDSGYGTQPQSVVMGYRSNNPNPMTGTYPHKESTSFEHEQPYPANKGVRSGIRRPSLGPTHSVGEWVELNVSLVRHESGFGFRIVGGTEEGSQVSIGHIVPGGAADIDGRLQTGDEILSVDGQSVVHTSHHHVVQLMGAAALNGRVTIGVRRWVSAHPPPNSAQDGGYPRGMDSGNVYPYDVTVSRRENEGFGFVIISSVTKGVSFIGQIIRDSPAERSARLHVGDRILAVNHHDISRLHHGDIVNLIKDSGYTVTLTVGPPLDDTSSNASNSHREGSEALEEEQLYVVELNRGSHGFGFSIRGGSEFHNMPLFVLRIAENGSAAQDGRLRVGDQLIEINGINTKNMTHADAIQLIKNGGPVVRLLLRRGSNVALQQGEGGDMAMSPISTASPTTPLGGNEMRPNSSLAQPQPVNSYPTSNGPLPPPLNGMATHHGPPPYLTGPRVPPSGIAGGRGPVPAPLNAPPMHRGLNGPLSHSSPRVISGNPVGGDYYWGS